MKEQIEQQDRQFDARQLPALVDWVVDQAIAIQQIAAPTFAENERAAYLAERFRELGLHDVTTDAVFNAYGVLPGRDRARPGLLLCAHTDTIFAADTDLTIRRDNGVIYGPGLGDNSVGVAGMLGVLQALQQGGVTPPRDIWWVATSREEGLGNLGGIRAAYERLADRIDAVINIEGLAFGHIYHAGIAVRRLHITVTADGGHSWLHFGRPSAIHGLMQLGGHLLALEPATTPRTTYNIGLIDGGHAINALATHADMWLDLRSEDMHELGRLEDRVRAAIGSLHSADLRFDVQVVGDRPSGRIEPSHPLVQGALCALDRVGVRGTLETGSTDGNIPLAHGCPAVTVGVTRGGNAHRLDEFVEVAPIADGMRQLIVLVLAAAQA